MALFTTILALKYVFGVSDTATSALSAAIGVVMVACVTGYFANKTTRMVSTVDAKKADVLMVEALQAEVSRQQVRGDRLQAQCDNLQVRLNEALGRETRMSVDLDIKTRQIQVLNGSVSALQQQLRRENGGHD